MSEALNTTVATATTTVARSTRSMKSNDSHALKVKLAAPTSIPNWLCNSSTPVSKPNQAKNIEMKSRTAETPAIFSP
jgi:hypothetical protein